MPEPDRRVLALKQRPRPPTEDPQRELWLAYRRLLKHEEQVSRSRRALIALIEKAYNVTE